VLQVKIRDPVYTVNEANRSDVHLCPVQKIGKMLWASDAPVGGYLKVVYIRAGVNRAGVH
jgi:hypothetical protein